MSIYSLFTIRYPMFYVPSNPLLTPLLSPDQEKAGVSCPQPLTTVPLPVTTAQMTSVTAATAGLS